MPIPKTWIHFLADLLGTGKPIFPRTGRPVSRTYRSHTAGS